MSLFSNKTSTASLISEARKAETAKGKTSARPKVMSFISVYRISYISYFHIYFRGRTLIDSYTQNVQWTFGEAEGVKRPDVFKIFVSSIFFREVYARNFILQLSFAVYFVSVNFDSS